MPKKKNPVEDFIDYRSKEAAKRAEQDLQDWMAWDQGGRSAEALKPLMDRYNPLINRKVREWGAPNVSPVGMKNALRKEFINAAHDYDPNRGVAFNTYMQSRLVKAQRFNAKHQNVGFIPEDKSRLIGKIDVISNQFQEELGRTPTPEEISAKMHEQFGISTTPKKITETIGARRKDVPSSMFETDPTGFAGSREDEVLRLIQRRPEDYLSPEEAKVFKHIYGVGGTRKVTSTSELANILGTNQSKISRIKTSIGDKIKKHM